MGLTAATHLAAHLVMHLHCCDYITVRNCHFQPAICYVSDEWAYYMHAQLIRSVKNAKLFTATLSPSRPAIYLPICIRNNKHAASQNAKIISLTCMHSKCLTSYLLVGQMSKCQAWRKRWLLRFEVLKQFVLRINCPCKVNAFYYKETMACVRVMLPFANWYFQSLDRNEDTVC